MICVSPRFFRQISTHLRLKVGDDFMIHKVKKKMPKNKLDVCVAKIDEDFILLKRWGTSLTFAVFL